MTVHGHSVIKVVQNKCGSHNKGADNGVKPWVKYNRLNETRNCCLFWTSPNRRSSFLLFRVFYSWNEQCLLLRSFIPCQWLTAWFLFTIPCPLAGAFILRQVKIFRNRNLVAFFAWFHSRDLGSDTRASYWHVIENVSQLNASENKERKSSLSVTLSFFCLEVHLVSKLLVY